MGCKRCAKCEGKREITKHHIFWYDIQYNLKYDSKLPLLILLGWLERKHDEVTILFWKTEQILLCRKCHDKFHILFSRLIKECDIIQSEEPIRKYLMDNRIVHKKSQSDLEDKDGERVGSRYEHTY